jgi:hypothetical protein
VSIDISNIIAGTSVFMTSSLGLRLEFEVEDRAAHIQKDVSGSLRENCRNALMRSGCLVVLDRHYECGKRIETGRP